MNMKKNKFKSILSKSYKQIVSPDFDSIINPKFIKKLRKNLNMSQITFAEAIGVSSNTVEKWEMEINKPSGATKRLLFLLDKNIELTRQIFDIQTVETIEIKKYTLANLKRSDNQMYINRLTPSFKNDFAEKEDKSFSINIEQNLDNNSKNYQKYFA